MDPSSRPRVYFLLVPVVVWSAWIVLMTTVEKWPLFGDKWFMTLTMCLGSFIAGATSEGGGAVAFPAMTLVFGIRPEVARDFSLMIQSVGMTSASVLIILFRIRVEWRAVVFSGLGGVIGVAIGLSVIAPRLPPSFVKMFFTSLWLSFAASIYWMNRDKSRVTSDLIERFGPGDAALLIGIGIVGGTVSGITGSGLDIMTFMLLTLLYNVCERVATPTSVLLMAGNAVVGLVWRGLVQQGLAAEAWDYWYVCVPVVVVGAPLGAYFIRQRTRQFIVAFLCLSISMQFVAALFIVPQTPSLALFSLTTVVLGLAFFATVVSLGARRRRLAVSD